MKNNFVVFIQARQTSKRFPNKIFQKIGKKNLLEIIHHRVSLSKKIRKILFVIPSSKDNNEISNFLKSKKYNFFRGSEKNVLDRFLKAASKNGVKNIIRITADCPLVDGRMIDLLINKFDSLKLDYINNSKPPLFCDGFDIEIISTQALKQIYKNNPSKHDLEHVTSSIRNNKKYKKLSLQLLETFGLNLSIDRPKDFNLVKKIFSKFKYNYSFRAKDIFESKNIVPEIKNKIKKFILFQNKNLKGQKLWKKSLSIIQGGNMLLSKNPTRFLPDQWPTYFERSKGCKIKDLDGNTYFDFSLMGVGTNILGYANSFVDNGVKKIIEKGNLTTLNCPEEVHLAKKLIELHPWAHKVKLARTGGEANSIAVRIARAFSKKNNIAICGYHGWHDWYLSANLKNKKTLSTHLLEGLEIDGVNTKLKKTVFPFNYGDLEGLKKIIKNNNIGVIKMEVCRNSSPNLNFLRSIRDITKEKKIVLIFDECTTGFREICGGIHMKYKIYPDMCVLGKTLGNGYAITAVLGKKEIMEAANRSFISSTFWTERIGPTAAIKTIDYMQKYRPWNKINKLGLNFRKIWLSLAKKHNLIIKILGIPALSSFVFESKNNQEYKTLITQEMLKENFLAANAIYVTLAHNNKSLIKRYTSALNKIFYKISLCEQGDDISKYLKFPVSVKDFKRLN